ncbi:hypothetical protein F4604DRAFT_1917497 [Suillus subluteus]|nr:hypothetical protein F4604DRAFT_1917497 [Suillus subluteus]
MHCIIHKVINNPVKFFTAEPTPPLAIPPAIQEGLIPAAAIQGGLTPPAAAIQGRLMPVAAIQRGLMPAAAIQRGLMPAAAIQRGLMPAAAIQGGLTPAAAIQGGHMPVPVALLVIPAGVPPLSIPEGLIPPIRELTLIIVIPV